MEYLGPRVLGARTRDFLYTYPCSDLGIFGTHTLVVLFPRRIPLSGDTVSTVHLQTSSGAWSPSPVQTNREPVSISHTSNFLTSSSYQRGSEGYGHT